MSKKVAKQHKDKLELSHLVVRVRPTCFHEMLGLDPNDPESAEVNAIIEKGHRELQELENTIRDLAAIGLASPRVFR